MNQVKSEMLKIYKPKGLDWLGYRITRQNPFSYHHIQKACDGGLKTIENGAILTTISHEYLNIIELKDYDIYLSLNRMLQIINNQQHSPTLEEYRIINSYLKNFEREHISDVNSKGRILIKSAYLKRSIYDL